ncbi:CobW family GTP-binding protein [Enterovirga rhinocerotis]|uniref:Cobalamin biosynthesis protein CobW n=1 Tax=Enterovirga rhinocerotis TaxID=1339210 RepID=A0A4R7BJ51_9HYPH|nr:GTP-binding protein [Enterovirga rhinocerotis]TDR85354.1 cobalamin biosynthesis protein CobW [Enterovirga rhinocerotis]
MTIPVVLVAGFLGAGKTTLVNEMLRRPDGRRIAAVVNDFGAIDIDADLLRQSSDGVVSLRNGCICCSLQGDLMRTLATLIRRQPPPDAIVIETSGASDPAEIVRSLLDPVVYAATPLETAVTVIDARHLADRPALFDDPLWRSQVASADICVLAKTDLVDEAGLAALRAVLARFKAQHLIVDAGDHLSPTRRFFSENEPRVRAPSKGSMPQAADERFETQSWSSERPVVLAAFQSAVARLAPFLLRAKGVVTFTHEPGRPMLFQLVGSRATIVPAQTGPMDRGGARLVLIAERGRLDWEDAARLLDASVDIEPIRSAPSRRVDRH